VYSYHAATEADIEELIRVRLEFLQDLHGPQPADEVEKLSRAIREYLATEIPAGRFVAWLCRSEGATAGVAGIAFYRLPPSFRNPSGRVGYIMNIYTVPAHRRRGIARVLLEKVVEDARSRGVGRLVLHATAEGRPLYEAHGFADTGDEMIRVL
jgi:GNAT superfamily N-acetyltransferase